MVREEFANPAFKGAYKKGVQAAKDGKEKRDCPYSDKRKSDGGLTFSRAFKNRWLEGFRDQKENPDEVSFGKTQ